MFSLTKKTAVIRQAESGFILLLVVIICWVVLYQWRQSSQINSDAHRIINFIERVRILAVFEERSYGVFMGPRGIVARYRAEKQWHPGRQMVNSIGADIDVISGISAVVKNRDYSRQPQVVVFPNGNITPFKWMLSSAETDQQLYLEADAMGKITLQD